MHVLTRANEKYMGQKVYAFVIMPKEISITADDIEIGAGEALPEFTYTAEGLLGGDVLLKEPELTCDIDNTDVEGAYEIIPSGAEAGNNYSIKYVNGTLNIGSAVTKYTVTFDLQGHGTKIDPVTVKSGEKLTKPSNPTAEGYSFEGWYREPECKTAWDFTKDTVTADTTLYAKWTQNQSDGYDLSSFHFQMTDIRNPEKKADFNGADGKQAVIVFGSLETCAMTVAAMADLTKLTGMVDMSKLNIYLFDVGKSSDEIIVSKSADISDKIMINSVENSTSYKSLESACVGATTGYGKVSIPLIIYKGTNGKIYKYTSGGTQLNVIIGNVEAGGIKVSDEGPGEEFTVTFDSQGGTEVPAARAAKDSVIAEPAAPTRQGYTFGGWYKEAACINAWDFANDKVTENITLYAKWTESQSEEPDDDKDDSPYQLNDRIDLYAAAGGAVANIKAKTYDGNPYLPIVRVTVMDGGKKKTLTEGIEYRVLYKNNVDAGTGTVIVRGNGIYKGEITRDFEIKPKPIKKLKVITGSMTVGDTSVPPVCVYDGTRLLSSAEYRLDYDGSLTAKKTNAAKVTITAAKGSNYTGSVTAKLAVYEGDASSIINPVNVTLKYTETTYTGRAIKDNEPTVKIGDNVLVKNKDYKVQFQNNTNAGTGFVVVTGKGAYKGKVVKPFGIKPVTGVQWSGKLIPDKTYNGKLQKPAVTGVKAGNKKLAKNKDYTVSYSNNLHAGTAKVTITGKGNYAGQTVYLTFTIKPQKISKASVKGTKENLRITYGGKILKEGTHYETPSFDETSIKKNKIKVTITGKGDFTGSVTKTVKVQ